MEEVREIILKASSFGIVSFRAEFLLRFRKFIFEINGTGVRNATRDQLTVLITPRHLV